MVEVTLETPTGNASVVVVTSASVASVPTRLEVVTVAFTVAVPATLLPESA